MTKARDLANSAAAFAAVSATELGYVDGVTSAIQTQIDTKAPSSTAATLTGTQTLTNKTIDTASNTITGAVTLTGTQTLTNKTLTSPALTTPTISTATTNGDILYGTGSGALSRLGIGSSAQVLTVASGVPSWATPASGLTLIKRATTTGAVNTGTTFDSVFTSTYKTYVIYIENWIAATGPDVPKIQMRYGGSTRATDYYGLAQNIDRAGAVAYNSTVNQASLQMGASGALDSAAGAAYQIIANRVGNSSQKPQLFFSGTGTGSQIYISGTLFNDAPSTYDGFLLSAASNITVTVAVYGLATA